MRYAVIWEKGAIAALGNIWLAGPHRNSISAAQAAIDQLLSLNPKGNGAPVSEGLWAIERAPLRVLYEIHEAHRLVLVTLVADSRDLLDCQT